MLSSGFFDRCSNCRQVLCLTSAHKHEHGSSQVVDLLE
jgi:hypothetical protein